MLSKNGPLTSFGFSQIAEKIYLTLLKKGDCSVSDLASFIGKHRPTVYKVLPELLSANLVSKICKGKRIVYKAESPAGLSTVVKRQLTVLEDELPELLKVFLARDKKAKLSFFEGREGIATAYEQFIRTVAKGGSIYRYESPLDYKRNKRYYPTLYWKRAGVGGDIDKYVITNKKTHLTRKNNLNRLSKAVTVNFENNITQLISDQKVVFIDFDTESAVLIEGERFADFQKTIFKMFFEKL